MVIDPLLAFCSGIGVSFAGAIVTNVLAKRRERQRAVEERRFGIYMKMLELYGSYFWFTAPREPNEPVPIEIRNTCRALSMKIADMLRAADEVEFLEQTLDVLFRPSFRSSQERYAAMTKLLDAYGRRINPRYAKRMREISAENIQLFGANGYSNAPGATDLFHKP